MSGKAAPTGTGTGWLLAAAVVGFGGLNLTCAYGLVHREQLVAVLTDPAGLALSCAAALLAPLLAWTFARGRLARLHWGWFVMLTLIGGLVFALPVALLWSEEDPGEAWREHAT
ncbi:MAG: hypothetical protein IPM29_01925 [Planctomycetes bacterium]|nr:hypothetical protein [Planctomycetota bacterium]